MPTFPQDFALKYRLVWSPNASDAAMEEFFNRLGRDKNPFQKSPVASAASHAEHDDTHTVNCHARRRTREDMP
jgi:hypothetical protein